MANTKWHGLLGKRRKYIYGAIWNSSSEETKKAKQKKKELI